MVISIVSDNLSKISMLMMLNSLHLERCQMILIANLTLCKNSSTILLITPDCLVRRLLMKALTITTSRLQKQITNSQQYLNHREIRLILKYQDDLSWTQNVKQSLVRLLIFSSRKFMTSSL